jgi:hypothetical protein
VLAGVGAQGVEVGVEAHPREPPRVEQPEHPAVGEGDREPEPLRLLDPVAPPRRAERAALAVHAHLPGHAQVHAQVRARLAVAAGGLAPHGLPAPPGGGEPPTDQRSRDPARRVRAAHPLVVVVDAADDPVDGAGEDLAAQLDLGELRHTCILAPYRSGCTTADDVASRNRRALSINWL